MDINWKDILGTIATVAPTVATTLGGPLAGLAVSVVSSALGIEGSEDAIAEAVKTGNPEIFLKLKVAENELVTKLKELDVELESISQKDRESARNREVQANDRTPKILGGLIISGFFIVIGVLLFNGLSGIPPEVIGLMGILIGEVSAKAQQVVNYYFGSSAGSRRKTEQFTDLFNKKPG